MFRHAILPLAFTVATLASAEPAGVSKGKSPGAYVNSGDKAGAKKPAAPVEAYELRGFFGADENLEVSVRRAGSERSQWFRVGQKSGDVTVEQADAKVGTATLVVNGVRHRLRLAAEAAPVAASVPATPVVVAETPSGPPDYKSAEYRRKRFGEMDKKMTAAQHQEFERIRQERFGKLNAENPNYDHQDPKNLDAMLGILREASEAAQKLPDREGKITPLPADYDALMRENIKAGMEQVNARREARRAELEREKAAAASAPKNNGETPSAP